MHKPLFFHNLPVVGAYHQTGVDWSKLREGDKLDLVPEPDNPADPCAVAVQVHGYRIGYLPREHAEVFSPLLLSGYVRTKAFLVGIDSWVERRRHAPILMDCEVVATATP